MAFIAFLKSQRHLIKVIAIAAVLSALVTAAIIIAVFVLLHREILPVEHEKISRGTVVSNVVGCANIGTNIMEKGGNAVDVAIATLFCEGVAMPSTMGLGGGFLMTIYNKTTGEMWSLNAREVAPAAATIDMFQGNEKLSVSGGLSVAVPGELMGYWSAYQKFGGGVPWKDLIQPTIDICKKGVLVNGFVAGLLQEYKNDLYADSVLREIFFDPETNDTYTEGQYYTRPKLARTLEIIATEGADALYNGSLTDEFVRDIQDHNGIITVDDLNSYRAEWQKPIEATLSGNIKLYTAPLPGSGSILTFILNVLDKFLDVKKPTSITNYQRIVESFKFGYARRSELGDSNFVDVEEILETLLSRRYGRRTRNMIRDHWTSSNASYYGARFVMPEDHGTAHISVLTPSGDAVSVTSTINYVFGAKFASNSTGIILNDQMDDFSSPNITNVFGIPPSPSNYIIPGKRPMSSTCPSIILNKNKEVVMIIGGAGGSKITSSVAQVILNHLWYGMDLKAASDAKRIHHQLFPMEVAFEEEYLMEDTFVVEGLQRIGHNVSFSNGNGFAAITAISRNEDNSVTGVFDRRRPGSVSYVY
ncbi:scoloptoxin SSD14 [Leptinotarsa decemlineata]|uniref:scoloptoxin SSD14 n=1 Tax=Leptinotarsa decemlineata TaxID=7539 RepID=UPI000C252681|nr:glutathione hydrolase 1 proenzyme-like [Leptinotarsa decemlineata]